MGAHLMGSAGTSVGHAVSTAGMLLVANLMGLWLYVPARLHEDPSLAPEQVVEEFLAAFGPARDAVRAYFEHWETVSGRVTDARVGSWCTDLRMPELKPNAGKWRAVSTGEPALRSPTDVIALADGRLLLAGEGCLLPLAQLGETDRPGDDARHLRAPTQVSLRGTLAVIGDSGNQRVIKVELAP
jgi:hypothetical protein